MGRNVEKRKQYMHDYYVKNRDKFTSYQLRYAEDPQARESMLQRKREYYAKNKEKLLAGSRERKKVWRASSFRYNISHSLAKAKERNHVDVTVDEVMRLLRDQGNVCAVTKLPFGRASNGVVSPYSISIDRVCQDKGYVLGNIRLVLFCVNTFRGRMSDEEAAMVADLMAKGFKHEQD